ncbi:MAG: 4-(cytidine 5'-diphospho)-2-C-methyl-D-erythritol kinase [Desulfuromonas sp.]|nr:MAG: 4-(cytidine 5'-diphospho)-2-C-methyl-D-erythritol kinase [Desulfuromonas sp.]
MKREKTYRAPAKINTCLHVLGKRPDGYHELAMLMQPISLYDEVEIACDEGSGIEVICPGVEMPEGADNIAARAAAELLRFAGVEYAVRIRIEKNIPVAAGLGGGSSDAATVLIGLNELLRLDVDRRELMRIGASLGADVPFFIFGGPAWATGIGDRLEKVASMPDLWYVLVNPGVAVSTAWVYGNLRLTSSGDVDKLRRFPETTEEFVRLLHNDLEPVTMSRYPVVGEIKQRLIECGAIGSLMSGSGPTVFGVFTSEEAARNAYRRLEAETDWRVLTVSPLD